MSSFKINQEVPSLPQIIEVQGIYIKQYPLSLPPPTISDKGTIYMDNGVLTYKGIVGTVTSIANS